MVVQVNYYEKIVVSLVLRYFYAQIDGIYCPWMECRK